MTCWVSKQRKAYTKPYIANVCKKQDTTLRFSFLLFTEKDSLIISEKEGLLLFISELNPKHDRAESNWLGLTATRRGNGGDGGEGGIRTLDRGLAYTPLAGARLRPLGHLSLEWGAHHIITRHDEKMRKWLLAKGKLSLSGGLFLFLLDTLVDLFAVNGNLFRRVDANANLIALHTQDGNGNVIANHQGFTNTTGKNQHTTTSPENSQGPGTGTTRSL